jgi:hypothetical protein
MATTVKQDNDFLRAVMPNSLLEEAIAWISSHLYPEDVFKEKTLEDWAKRNGFTEE